ncbi:molybdopterin-binding protein [Ruegeria sp. 2205SS24-7]|uniref:molybdopterin-binding protein n=1 Tax=Ruegeria discodermiae TaxID=3064389 RepID=UPI00274082FE|nr:gephyrin-like molybdotransferase Glp [Ruegeria sp. 2205SS24-7]MDP5217485.1 molybdopterin-binding protein [Ruegeria sp. 2205SS24-7]
MTPFQTIAMVDWSGGNDTGPKPRKDAIWACVIRAGACEAPIYLRNRARAEVWLGDLIETELAAGRRLMLGFDFPFGYPAGFARSITGTDDPLTLWEWFADHIEDAPDHNNRFDLAGQINRRFGGVGPFWGNGLKRDIVGLPRTKTGYQNPFPDRRAVEELAKGSFTCWQMSGAGAVGGQVMMGLPVLTRLRHRFAGQIAAWPFEALDKPVAFVEIWPSLTLGTSPADRIRDAWQVEHVARDLAGLPAEELTRRLTVEAPEEGWILGVDQNRSTIAPPPLRNDCFALPAGVSWTPVDDALALLRDRLRAVTSIEEIPVMDAMGRVLAEDCIALRSNPPQANTAVDGYGFSGGLPEGAHVLPLADGRAAAGAAFAGTVPAGHAIRILTGATLPEGVDTIALQEDVTVEPDRIALNGPLKQGANARQAGEDVAQGDIVLEASRVLSAADLALATAVGIARLRVRKPLKVAVLSTGDELTDPGEDAGRDGIYDANRPMLLATLRAFGFEAVDVGRVGDDRAALRQRLDAAAQEADAILTSGGASDGDEDHMSAVLRDAGAMQEWRIAIKPGRPLALGLWQDKPVFGLPGNPVAALVCTLIFARPALAQLAGAGWSDPQGFDMPAAFEKRKKPGRREYLRARVREGRVEVFASEGSGRISGLSWAEGLVELGDGACHIRPGDAVRYIPYVSFGL